MEFFDRLSDHLNRILIIIAGAFLLGMILLTCANILLRLFWFPVRGTFELMGFFGAVATAFALGYTQMKKTHIAVDILVNRFPARIRTLLNGINYFVCSLFFGVAGWQIARWAGTMPWTRTAPSSRLAVCLPMT